MSFKGPAEDRLAIQELNQSYADAVHRGDAEAWAALWAHDCRWLHPAFGIIVGRADVGQTFARVRGDYALLTFTVMMGALTVNGDRASGRAYTTEWVVHKSGESYRTHGLYQDEYVRTEEGWLFAVRAFTVLDRG